MTNLEKGQIRKFLLGGIQALIKNKQTNKTFIYLHYSPNMQTISKQISFEYFIVIGSMRSRFCKYFDSRQVPKKKKKTPQIWWTGPDTTSPGSATGEQLCVQCTSLWISASPIEFS